MVKPISRRLESRQDRCREYLLLHHAARNMLVSQRTQIINQIRGFATSMGERIGGCSTEKFHELNRSAWSRDLDDAAWPLIGVLKAVTEGKKSYQEKKAA